MELRSSLLRGAELAEHALSRVPAAAFRANPVGGARRSRHGVGWRSFHETALQGALGAQADLQYTMGIQGRAVDRAHDVSKSMDA